jgi:hypothetical protein
MTFSVMWRRVVEVYRLLEESIAFIFRFELQAKQSVRQKQAENRNTLPPACLDPENGGSTLLQNVGKLLLDHTSSYPTRHYSSDVLPSGLWHLQIPKARFRYCGLHAAPAGSDATDGSCLLLRQNVTLSAVYRVDSEHGCCERDSFLYCDMTPKSRNTTIC